ncbi:MAG: hypothetical protein CM15mP78_05200 [Candidatus Poseidoniales archaeon]|nr:MAG: hypothetical protein CM15mP78_05200 [Candidatus Poseidoniales archaeon]
MVWARRAMPLLSSRGTWGHANEFFLTDDHATADINLRQGGQRIEHTQSLDFLLVVNQLHDVGLAVFFHEHGPFHRVPERPTGPLVLRFCIPLLSDDGERFWSLA